MYAVSRRHAVWAARRQSVWLDRAGRVEATPFGPTGP
jgi:hypothetical protein